MTKKYALRVAGAAICILLPAIILYGIFCGVRFRLRTIPDVRGMTVADARTAFEKAGLHMMLQEEYSRDHPAGTVIDQIRRGREVWVGDWCSVTVSLGVKMVEVPDLTGASAQNAQICLEKTGLRAVLQYEYHDNAVKGLVAYQRIAPGEIVPEDSTVAVVISKGFKPTPMPDVVQKTAAEASSLLEELGLEFVIYKGYSETVPSGTVMTQTPNTAAIIDGNTEIILTVSQGPYWISAPDVTGLDVQEARQLLKDSEFTVVIQSGYSDTDPQGAVLSQKPAPGQRVARGDTVILTVSKGPDVVKLPDVTGLSRKNAEIRLKGVGFRTVIQWKYTDAALEETVLSQDPAPKTVVRRGSTVTITLGLPYSKAVVPDVTALTPVEAKRVLTEAGFRIGFMDNLTVSTAKGTAKSQWPPANQVAEKGDWVCVVFVP